MLIGNYWGTPVNTAATFAGHRPPVPWILFGAFWFQKRLAPHYAEVRAAVGDVGAGHNNNPLGLATTKAFVAEGFESGRLHPFSGSGP